MNMKRQKRKKDRGEEENESVVRAEVCLRS